MSFLPSLFGRTAAPATESTAVSSEPYNEPADPFLSYLGELIAQLERGEQQPSNTFLSATPIQTSIVQGIHNLAKKGVMNSSDKVMSEATLAKINDIQKVTDAVAVGDLSQRVDVDGSGDELDSLKNSVNNMVNKLAQFDNEVSNIYPEFDCERVLGGAARPDLRGSWRELFNLVNRQAATSTNQTRSLAQVTKAVALGDLSRLMDHDVTGEMLELKNTVNVMVLRLRTMVTTIMRMVEDVGKGNLGSQVDLNELDGVWLELGQKVSNMSTNVTEHVRSVHVTIAAINRGEVHTKLPAAQHQGEFRTVGECVSTLVDLISNLSVEISRVVENGRQGQLDEPTRITSDFPGMWAGILNDVEMFARTLTSQTHSLTVALTALSDGDFSKAMDGDFEGEMLTLKDTVNFIRSQLIGLERSLFLILRPRRVEVSKRVACKGTWKDIVYGINIMATYLPDPSIFGEGEGDPGESDEDI